MFNKISYLLFIILPSSCWCNDNNLVIPYHNYKIKLFILIIFIACYVLVILEEFLKIKKSKVTILTSTLMWLLIFSTSFDKTHLNELVKTFILEYCELFLFLFVTMVYINTIKHFGVLNYIQSYIVYLNLSYRQIFWFTGAVSFLMSPIADNLTTALLMGSVILSVDKYNYSFVNLSFINIIVAANAGGAFSPFGDITTLMIWQKGILHFHDFFYIFLPSFVNFMIPSIIISKYLPLGSPKRSMLKVSRKLDTATKVLLLLFIFTIFLTIVLQTALNIPAVIGMMTGLSLLQVFEYFNNKYNEYKLNTNNQIHNIEWETLLFFYGIMLCVGCLSTVGILNDISGFIYLKLGGYIVNPAYTALPGNFIIGILSAIIDNIPVTFAVINMNHEMSVGQWLLVTLAVGTGGSLFSIGSAAGIALMGQASKAYTFFSHLKFTWAIFVGYILGLLTHIILNNKLFFLFC